MLQSMRASAQGWIGRVVMAILMGLIILSFAIWGIGDIFRGFGANNLAQVGSVAIGADTYRNAYQAQLQNLERAERRNITNEEAHQFGIDRQVLSQLVNEAALDNQARGLGLAISDEEIKKAIVNDDNFKGVSGRFDRQGFDAFLRDEGFTEKTYVRQQRSVRLRRQIVDALTNGVQLPKALLEAIFRFQMETRSVDYVVFPNAGAGPLPAPSQEELTGYFEMTRQLYATPEFRGLVVVLVTPASIARPDDVSDADARNRYEEVKNERFGAPEKREVEQNSLCERCGGRGGPRKTRCGKDFRRSHGGEKSFPQGCEPRHRRADRPYR